MRRGPSQPTSARAGLPQRLRPALPQPAEQLDINSIAAGASGSGTAVLWRSVFNNLLGAAPSLCFAGAWRHDYTLLICTRQAGHRRYGQGTRFGALLSRHSGRAQR